jgi:hypothetical protein
MSDHDLYSDSHSVWLAGAFARALGKFRSGYLSGWGNWNEQAGHLHFHGYLLLYF